MAAPLETMTSLESLSFDMNKMTDKGASVMARALHKLKQNGGKLSTFSFSNNKLTKAGERLLAEAMHAFGAGGIEGFTSETVTAYLAELKQRDAEQSRATAKEIEALGKVKDPKFVGMAATLMETM